MINVITPIDRFSSQALYCTLVRIFLRGESSPGMASGHGPGDRSICGASEISNRQGESCNDAAHRAALATTDAQPRYNTEYFAHVIIQCFLDKYGAVYGHAQQSPIKEL